MAVTSIRELLGVHPFFADLPSGDLDSIAGCGLHEGHPPGTFLLREGQPADRFFVIRDGTVAVEVHAPATGPVVVETLGPGDVVGWSWLFPPYRCQFDVEVTSPVRVTAFDGACLRGKCDADPALGFRLVRRFAAVISERLSATRLRLMDLYGRAG